MLMRQNIERRNQLRRRQIASFEQQVEKDFNGFKQRFGLLIAVDQNQQRLLDRLIQQNEIERLCGIHQARKREGALLAAKEVVQQSLKIRLPRRGLQKLSRCGVSHWYRARIFEAISVVE